MLVLVNWMANGVVFQRYPVKPESWIKALLSKSNSSALWIGSWSELWTKKTISSHSKKQVSANNNNKNNDNNLDSPNEAKRWMKSCNSKKLWTIDWLIMLTIRHNTYQKYVFYFHFEFLSLISCTIKSNIQVVVIVSYILNLKWWWQWDWWKKLMYQSLMKLHGEQLHCNQKKFKHYWFFNTTCWAGIFGKKL